MTSFSNLSPRTLITIAIIISYILSSEFEDRDEELSFASILVIMGIVLTSEANQKTIFIGRERDQQIFQLELEVLRLGEEINDLRTEIETIKLENNKKE